MNKGNGRGNLESWQRVYSLLLLSLFILGSKNGYDTKIAGHSCPAFLFAAPDVRKNWIVGYQIAFTLENKMITMDVTVIDLTARPSGRTNEYGEPIFEAVFKLQGAEGDIFALLTEAMKANDRFRHIVIEAVRYEMQHDDENCPHCRPQN